MTVETPPAEAPARVVALLCLAEALSMTGFSAYPAFLPGLRESWHWSGAQAGFVGGAFFFGYMLAVPFLSSATDRIDARSVFAASCGLTALGILGFAWGAQGTATGAFFQALTGAGLAGTYMPGLKALTDRVGGPRQARFIAFYTATFGIGSSLSLVLAGWLQSVLPWRMAFAALASGPAVALPFVLIAIRPLRPLPRRRANNAPGLLGTLKQVDIRRFVLGYAAHCWELFGLRSWMVAFIAFAAALSASRCPWFSPTEAAALINLLGLPASILGNEAAGNLGRLRWIAAAMGCAAVASWITGIAAVAAWWILLPLLAGYFICVMADSAALTAGLVAASPPDQRGVAMALYSLFGFGAGFAAPMVFGAALDLFGGTRVGWAVAFATLSGGGLVWSVAVRCGRPRSAAARSVSVRSIG